MRGLFLLLLATLGAPVWSAPAASGAPPRSPASSALEIEVLRAVNALRTRPRSFLPDLLRLRGQFEGTRLRLDARTQVMTQEGQGAVDEAIRFFQRAPATGKVAASALLARPARDHQQSQARDGEVGHEDHGLSPVARVEKYGRWRGKMGENISYGIYAGTSGRDVVIALAVDDGVPGRGHRRNLMEPGFHLVGIACGPHPRFGRMCVLDFAGGMQRK